MFSNTDDYSIMTFDSEVPQRRERAQSFVLERPQPVTVARKKLSFDDNLTDDSNSTLETDSVQSASFLLNLKKNISETPTKDIFQPNFLTSPKFEKEISFLSPIHKNSQKSFSIPPVFELNEENEKMVCEEPESDRSPQLKCIKRFGKGCFTIPLHEMVLESLDNSSSCFSTSRNYNFEDLSARSESTYVSQNETNMTQPELETPKRLPTTAKNIKNPDLNGINPDTLVNLINNDQNLKYLIIDCRYDYEYQGGHIKGAINVDSPETLEHIFFKNKHVISDSRFLDRLKEDPSGPLFTALMESDGTEMPETPPVDNSPPILIFHCEFSQKRGPRALRALRNLDRKINSANWPKLDYPEIYILEGGYKEFFGQCGEGYCTPNSYVEMVDKNYRAHYAEARQKEKKSWKKKTVISGMFESEVQNSQIVASHYGIDKMIHR